MKSKASIKSHPVHPILVSFPIAFFVGTVLFDVLGMYKTDPEFYLTARYMQIAGIIGAVLAAIPGIIDFIYTVPPHSSAKKRGRSHALTNTLMLILFITAYVYKNKQDPSPAIFISIELAGIVLLFIAGWMGGTLVYRNQIGVDPRYAHAGKWKEMQVPDETPMLVAKSDELKVDQMKLLHIRNKRIVLAKTETGYVAFDDRCTHKGGSLAGGIMICGTVQCPWHGSQFDVHTGALKAGPGKDPIQCYQVQEENGNIILLL